MKPYILFLNGLNDSRMIQVLGIGSDNSLRYDCSGSASVFRYMDSPDFDKKLVMLDTNKHSAVKIDREPNLIFNEISDADSHQITLAKATQIISQFKTCPVINRPQQILKTGREQIAKQLQGQPKIVIPLTLRIRPNSPAVIMVAIQQSPLQFPVIVRECGLHNGDKTILLKDAQDITPLHALAMDGREFYLTQFYDYSEQGVFRKLRIMVVDGQPCLRHVRYSDQWIVHHRTCFPFLQAHPHYIDTEVQILADFEQDLKPRIMPMVTRIYQTLKLEYFGIDCAIDSEDNLVIFEVNASMHCLSTSEKTTTRYDEPMAKINRAIVQMILSRAAQGVGSML